MWSITYIVLRLYLPATAADIPSDLPADTGTDVISPNVTNRLYVMAALNCVNMWNTVRPMRARAVRKQ